MVNGFFFEPGGGAAGVLIRFGLVPYLLRRSPVMSDWAANFFWDLAELAAHGAGATLAVVLKAALHGDDAAPESSASVAAAIRALALAAIIARRRLR